MRQDLSWTDVDPTTLYMQCTVYTSDYGHTGSLNLQIAKMILRREKVTSLISSVCCHLILGIVNPHTPELTWKWEVVTESQDSSIHFSLCRPPWRFMSGWVFIIFYQQFYYVILFILCFLSTVENKHLLHVEQDKCHFICMWQCEQNVTRVNIKIWIDWVVKWQQETNTTLNDPLCALPLSIAVSGFWTQSTRITTRSTTCKYDDIVMMMTPQRW